MRRRSEIIDFELRAWFRAQLAEVRAKALEELCRRDTKQRELRLALLRCPVGVADPEIKMLTDAWNDEARAAVPDTAVAIEIEREANDWCRLLVAVIASSMVTLAGGNRAEVLHALLTSSNDRAQRGFRAYAFSADDVARMRKLIVAEQRAGAASEPTALSRYAKWNVPAG